MSPVNGNNDSLPPIAALFLVIFDRKVGYTVAWKRSIQDVNLDGVVEYKSLPSGLHNVHDDLVYFTHNEFAGISAFLSKEAGEEERNAHFVAVGVLVPLSYGRLGRAWTHAQGLRELAEGIIGNITDTTSLEKYWDNHCMSTSNARRSSSGVESPLSGSPSRQRQPRRKRGLSEATAFTTSDHGLSQDHPALSMAELLETLGPLLFPLYRAALLRKRILLVGSPPIHRSCDFVYGLSIFSNIPPSIGDILPVSNSVKRIRPLFNVGVHDIPELTKLATNEGTEDSSEGQAEAGWLACTTDDIIGTKTQLYDIVVELPAVTEDESVSRSWPTIKTASGNIVKATQRDMRRYITLRKELQRSQLSKVHGSHDLERPEGDEVGDQDDEGEPLVDTKLSSQDDDLERMDSFDSNHRVVEPASWAAIAYTSFLWWASAGEKDDLLAEEGSQDSALLEDLPITSPTHRPSSSRDRKSKRASTGSAASIRSHSKDSEHTAMLLIAYFHRLTSLMLETLAELVNAADDEAENDDDSEIVIVESEDVRRMGLDVWSQADRQFLTDMVQLYFEREAEVQGRNVECCGIKIC